MTAFCFPGDRSQDHEAAVVRAFFENRKYFRFDPHRFMANSEEAVERIESREREQKRQEEMIRLGGDWLKRILAGTARPAPPFSELQLGLIEIRKSVYVQEKTGEEYELGRRIMEKAGIRTVEGVFDLLVRLGGFDEDENVDLLRFEVRVDFPREVAESADRLLRFHPPITEDAARMDLTGLATLTIDGQSTLDFDDALSIEDLGDRYRLGIHISDVAHLIPRGDPVEAEALLRASSVYLPDRKISMLPACLSEDGCSLRAGELRPTLTVMAEIDPTGEIRAWRLFPSRIRVSRQLTYHDVNQGADENPDFRILLDIARRFHRRRMDAGAVQINLPEIGVWVDPSGEISVTRVNRESPGRFLVSEIMILANWLMGRFLRDRGVAGIFRGQGGPRERLFTGDEASLFQNWMQRRLLNRYLLSAAPEPHEGLGLDVYLTATSPIRKAVDLVTQRQIRGALGLEPPRTPEEITGVIQALEAPMALAYRLQVNRHRYFLLKYLEGCIGRKEEAIVLYKKKRGFQVLLTGYMLECELPMVSGLQLKPEDLVQVTLQRVNARRDVLAVTLG